MHVAATDYLTVLHTGGRSKADIDAGGVLPGYTGTLVRDGYAGYTHLIDAHHAWWRPLPRPADPDLGPAPADRWGVRAGVVGIILVA